MKSSPHTAIVHVLAALRGGGAELNTIRLVNELAKRGYRQAVVSFSPDVEDHLKSSLSVPLYVQRNTRRFPGGGRFLAGVLNDFSADIIHGRSYQVWMDCCLAKKLCRRSVHLVQGFHGPTSFERQVLRRRITASWLRELTDLFVGVSEDLAQRLQQQWRASRERIRVIPNGIDLQHFRPPPNAAEAKVAIGIKPDCLVVGTVSSLRAVKNQSLLIQAFARFKQTRMDSLLLVVGEGPLRSDLQHQTQALNLGDHVSFCGYRNDVEKYLNAMDIFVQPSLKEGSPTAVLEAMSSAVATLSAPSSGCLELNQKYRLPLLFDSGSALDLARLLEQLADDQSMRMELGAEGRRIVTESFSFDQMVDAYADLYAQATCIDHREAALL